MPYIPKVVRVALDLEDAPLPENAGQLNYCLTAVAIRYVEDNGLSYESINDVMGAFACAAQEFYRRVAADYEDIKIVANGDCYPLSMTGIPRGE